jgi:hypothetical protein
MFRNFLLSICSLLLLVGSLTAQQRTCGANELLARQLLEDPFMQQRMQDIERQTEKFIEEGGATDRAVVTIPVVVHVVYYNSTQNISQSQIESQLQVLNDDFRRLNADAANTPSVFQGIAADCEVNFCLATQDPNGNATTGIQRRQTTVNGFSYTNDNVKFYSTGGLDIWDRNKYLNIWVCNISGGILGYAQFPGGPASTDGVVCDFAYFGTNGTATAPFDKGRTATHEVGHWLNLRHIWGDDGSSCSGTDQVSDTPNQADEHYGCPSFPQVSCSNGPNGDMFMNYMDYTDDACMNLFTAGQKSRMQALFGSGGARASLLSSPGCQPPGGGGSCGTPSGLSATNITQTSATVNWGSVSGATSYNLQWKLSGASTWNTVTGISGTSYGLSGLTAGTTYNYQVQAVCGSTSGNYSTSSSFTTTSGSCSDQYEANNTRSAAKVIPTNTTFTAQIATSSDVDWYRFSNTSSRRRIKIEMTTLPADYDVRLYRGNSNTILGISENAGTTDELIIYNTNTVANNYYAYVYGWNGAFSNTQCYTFRVSLSSSNWRTDGSTDGEVTEIEVPVMFENVAFGMFPNPATDQLTVEVPMENESDVQVSVLDPSGKVALQQHRLLTKGDNQMTLDVSSLPNGVYFVQVRNGETSSTRKLAVQR